MCALSKASGCLAVGILDDDIVMGAGLVELDGIYIKAHAKRNGFTLCLVGICGVVLSSLWLTFLPEVMQLAGFFLTCASLVAILIGWFKVREPVHSFSLHRDRLSYVNRFGGWQLDWDNIQRVDVPRILQGLEQKPLELVGIRVKHYEPLLDCISLRLASNILMQQRALLLQADSEQCQTGRCYSANLLEQDRYKSASGKRYTGMKAMFAHRMARMREVLGYDLFVYQSDLDRPAEDFVRLLRECQQQTVLNQD
ncbi:hypothetical protein HMF8227_02712 [Saliniradius amylolyticus]|uniref:DUF2982 domain-containing protein n=1 Tax=Saliniradius amylolyticus TaxID=2183582 RepID=A0A2S2E699_9ALTE|nr:DUF2982 domain-containing protein [Saliniradius amylolyticus]AWL13163.1 hypothetical protein HMF8227_02712 [Saliniradius amylolyticus]